MFNDTRVYDLSFVSPARGKRSKPQIVFSINKDHFEVISQRLARLCEVESGKVEPYFGFKKSFSPLTTDWFGYSEFGFGNCGFCTEENGEVQLRIKLSEAGVYDAALTINFLVSALFLAPEDGKYISNQLQQVDLLTNCDNHRVQGYGHAVRGYVSSRILDWLRKKAKGSQEGHAVAMPEAVIRAMKTTWYTLSTNHGEINLKKWTKDCEGYISADGRFVLICFGNACDLAIYPETFHGSREHGEEFGCHNLDTAVQQLTLLAGLAKLCELARQDE